MKLNEACRIGKKAGCQTVGEAILNVEIHATSMFKLSDMVEELLELAEDSESYADDVLINDILSEK